MEIGYTGFRASNRAYSIHFFSPDDPKCVRTNNVIQVKCVRGHTSICEQ
jgi:hypothetical protein